MSVYLDQLQFNGTVDGVTWYSQWVDLSGFTHLRVMVYSNPAYDFSVQWSINSGVDVDLQDNLSAVIDTQRLSLPVRARYVRCFFSGSVINQPLRLCVATSI